MFSRFVAPRWIPGSVLEKKLTGGLGLLFWVWNFWYSYFFGFGKISLIFLGLKIFHLFFWGSNFDTIYFFGGPVRRIAQIAQRIYFCGFVIFMNLFFWVWFFLVFIFLGIPKNAWAEPPCHLHVRVHSLGDEYHTKTSNIHSLIITHIHGDIESQQIKIMWHAKYFAESDQVQTTKHKNIWHQSKISQHRLLTEVPSAGNWTVYDIFPFCGAQKVTLESRKRLDKDWFSVSHKPIHLYQQLNIHYNAADSLRRKYRQLTTSY